VLAAHPPGSAWPAATGRPGAGSGESQGSVWPVGARAGRRWASARGGVRLSTLRPASLLGAPTDVGAGDRGASMGPEALRVAGLQAALQDRGVQVFDLGNLSGPANPWQPPRDGYRHLSQVEYWNKGVHDAVLAELRLDRLPILLGGDHS